MRSLIFQCMTASCASSSYQTGHRAVYFLDPEVGLFFPSSHTSELEVKSPGEGTTSSAWLSDLAGSVSAFFSPCLDCFRPTGRTSTRKQMIPADERYISLGHEDDEQPLVDESLIYHTGSLFNGPHHVRRRYIRNQDPKDMAYPFDNPLLDTISENSQSLPGRASTGTPELFSEGSKAIHFTVEIEDNIGKNSKTFFSNSDSYAPHQSTRYASPTFEEQVILPLSSQRPSPPEEGDWIIEGVILGDSEDTTPIDSEDDGFVIVPEI